MWARFAARPIRSTVPAPSLFSRFYATRVVSFHYTLTNGKGEVLDTSRVTGRTALTFLEGTGHIIPGLEAEMTKLNTGDKKVVTVPAKDAYGEHKEASVFQNIPRDRFPEDVRIGDQFQVQMGEGGSVVTVTAVSDEGVTIDANHPLAGQDLTFDVEVTEAREATAEEISHGHVHGPGGHHH